MNYWLWEDVTSNGYRRRCSGHCWAASAPYFSWTARVHLKCNTEEGRLRSEASVCFQYSNIRNGKGHSWEHKWIKVFLPSVQFSHSVMSDSLRPHGLQHTRLPCPSPTPGICSNSCPLSQWCHPTISSSVVPFSFCLPSFPASGSFPMSQFFASGGQSIAVSASVTVLPMNIHFLLYHHLTLCIDLQHIHLFIWKNVFNQFPIYKSTYSPFMGDCLFLFQSSKQDWSVWRNWTALPNEWFGLACLGDEAL